MSDVLLLNNLSSFCVSDLSLGYLEQSGNRLANKPPRANRQISSSLAVRICMPVHFVSLVTHQTPTGPEQSKRSVDISLLAASSFHFMSASLWTGLARTHIRFGGRKSLWRVSKQLNYTLRCVDGGSLWIRLAPPTPALTITETLCFTCHVTLMPTRKFDYWERIMTAIILSHWRLIVRRAAQEECVCVCVCTLGHIAPCFRVWKLHSHVKLN